ncbi:MAG TPA: DUF4349 domain-containing protein [Acidimicrobiales bacterium]|nr:DUF4349 domain-containing protein [Acidimicrobiales bacterium]
MARKSWSLAAVAVVALVVAGAVQAGMGRSGDDEMSTVGRDMATTAPARATDSVAGAGGTAGSAPAFSGNAKAEVAPRPPDGGGPAPVVPGSPRVVRTADVRVKVAKGGFSAAFDRVASVAAANGGFVSASTTGSVDDARSGELTVRVPADRFDTLRLSLGELGDVESQSIRGEDVSGQLVDYDARLKSLQAQEESLLVLVGRATAVGEVLQVQSTLFNVRQQIEQLKAQQASLEQSVSLATLRVSLFEPGAGVVRPVDDGPSLARSFQEAIDGMVSVVGGMIVVVGYLIPIGVLGLLVWGGSRVVRRRPAPPAPAAPAV